MKFEETGFEGLYIILPKVFKDDRGFFYENYNKLLFEKVGINYNFVQDNHARSEEKGVLRGLHFQKPPFTQAKLVRVIKGAVYDVVVDLRRKSNSFQKWFGIELTDSNFRSLMIPPGFAHGYLVLKPETEFLYKVDNFYNPQCESGIIWNDPDLEIDWMVQNPILSEKDFKLPLLGESLNIF